MGRGLAQALMNIGDNVNQYVARSGQNEQQEKNRALQMDIARMREQNDLEVQRLKAELFGAGGVRGASSGSRGAQGQPMSPEFGAAAGGFESMGDYEAAQKRFKQGPEMIRTQDMTGRGMTGSLDEQDYGMVDEESPASKAAAQNVGKLRTGIIRSSMPANAWDDAEKAETTRSVREKAFDPNANSSDVNRRVGSMKGEGEYTIQGNTKLNKFSGESSSTEVGESVIKKNEDQGDAAKVRAAISRAQGGSGGGMDTVQRTIETGDGKVMLIYRSGKRELLTDDGGQPIPSNTYAKEIGKIVSGVEKSPWFMGKGKEEAKQGEVQRRSEQQFGKRETEKDQFVVGKTYKDGSGNRAIYRGNGKWETIR